MKNRKRGLSLIELMIGFLIIGGVTMVYFKMMNLSRRKSQFYSEHFVAALLAGKVVENCLQETEINPYGIEALGLADENKKPFKVSTLITDGQSVFFKYPQITEKDNPELFNQIKKDFLLKIQTDGSKKNQFRVTTSFDWEAMTGSGNFSFDCYFPDYVMKQHATSSFAFPENELEKKVVERILGGKSVALSAIVPSPSAAELALATGRIYFSTAGFLSSSELKSASEEAQKIKGEALSADSERFAQGTEKYFEIARDSLDLMLYLKPHIEFVAKNIKAAESMKTYYRYRMNDYLYRSGNAMAKLQQLFFICVNEAASRYKQQIKETSALRSQRFYVERCLSMHRIMYANRSFCSDEVFCSANAQNVIKAEYFDFLQVLLTHFETRDPAIFRLASQEKKFARDEAIRKRYFACDLTGKLFKSIEDLLKVVPAGTSGGSMYNAGVIGQPKGDGSVSGAVTWARDQLKSGQRKGLNQNNGMTSIDETAWDDWCLAFVNSAYGHQVDHLKAGSAVASMRSFDSAGKLKNDKRPPAGAIMFTDATPSNPYGHIFIATGKYSADGDPIVVTTGSPGWSGVREITLTEMLNAVGGKGFYRGWASVE